ncbi:MAG: hypothetical protein ACO2PN_20860 [Pyrobaculum sp.]
MRRGLWGRRGPLLGGGLGVPRRRWVAASRLRISAEEGGWGLCGGLLLRGVLRALV